MSKINFTFLARDYRDRSDFSKMDFSSDPGLTDQSFKNECDINIMLARGEQNLMSNHLRSFNGQYGDFTFDNVDNYHTAMCQIRETELMFNSLPARVRAKFDNDPGAFLAFTQNEANRDEMIDLGLMVPEAKKSSVIASNVSIQEVNPADKPV